MFLNDSYAHTHGKNADFVKSGGALSMKADRVTKLEDLDEKVKWFLFQDGNESAL